MRYCFVLDKCNDNSFSVLSDKKHFEVNNEMQGFRKTKRERERIFQILVMYYIALFC